MGGLTLIWEDFLDANTSGARDELECFEAPLDFRSNDSLCSRVGSTGKKFSELVSVFSTTAD